MLALTGVGLAVGMHDVSATTTALFVPVPADKRTHTTRAAAMAGSATGIAAVLIVREVLFPPPTSPPPAAPPGSATIGQRVVHAWASMEHTIRTFPYRQRLVTVIVAGLASGLCAVIAENWTMRQLQAAPSTNTTTSSSSSSYAAAGAQRSSPSSETLPSLADRASEAWRVLQGRAADRRAARAANSDTPADGQSAAEAENEAAVMGSAESAKLEEFRSASGVESDSWSRADDPATTPLTVHDTSSASSGASGPIDVLGSLEDHDAEVLDEHSKRSNRH